MSSFFAPIGFHPLTIFLILIAFGGIIFSVGEIILGIWNKRLVNIVTLLLLIIIVVDIFLFFAKIEPFPERYVHEFYVLSAIFSSIFIVKIRRLFPKKISIILISIVLTIGIIAEFSEFGKYGRGFVIDWEYLDFYQWLEKNIPPNASILTDPFTLHGILGAVPYAHQPEGNQFDPISVISNIVPGEISDALSLICPQYIIIDKALTGIPYPFTLQTNPLLFSEFMTLVYDEKTSLSQITVFKLNSGVCENKN